jgi:hypothetical protein
MVILLCDFNLGTLLFKYEPGHQLSLLAFMIFMVPLGQCLNAAVLLMLLSVIMHCYQVIQHIRS